MDGQGDSRHDLPTATLKFEKATAQLLEPDRGRELFRVRLQRLIQADINFQQSCTIRNDLQRQFLIEFEVLPNVEDRAVARSGNLRRIDGTEINDINDLAGAVRIVVRHHARGSTRIVFRQYTRILAVMEMVVLGRIKISCPMLQIETGQQPVQGRRAVVSVTDVMDEADDSFTVGIDRVEDLFIAVVAIVDPLPCASIKIRADSFSIFKVIGREGELRQWIRVLKCMRKTRGDCLHVDFLSYVD